MQELNWVALTIFALLFGFITWLGFAAARWRRGDLDLACDRMKEMKA